MVAEMLSHGDNNLHHHRLRQPQPSQDEPTATPRVLTVISSVLEKLVARNDQLEQQHGGNGVTNWGGSTSLEKSLKAFHGVRAPSISISKYLERIYNYTNCSPSCFVVGYVYIDRLVHKYPDRFLVVSLNFHRLLVTSVMLASKMLDDVHQNNAFFARVGGVSNAELNRLELELLFLLDFRVVVTLQVFQSYCQHLEKEMLRDQTTYSSSIEAAISHSSSGKTDEDTHPSFPHST